MKRETEVIKCPLCKHQLEIDVDFVIKNERTFCTTCLKAFDIKIQRVHDEKKDDIADKLLQKHFERKTAELEEKEMEADKEDEDYFGDYF